MLFGDGANGNEFANAGVGENNIDSPLHLGDGLIKTIKVSQFGNVSLNSRNVGADCLHGLVEFLLAAARDEDERALFDEKLCRSQSDPFRAPGDDGHFSLQLAHSRSSAKVEVPGMLLRFRFDLRSRVDAAVDRQVRAVDVRRLRAGDERYQRCDLVGVSIPIKRNGRLLVCGPLA